MSAFGGFGGFGSNTNNNTTTTGSGFGFGSNQTTSSGFGSSTGFGSNSNTSGGGLFGGSTGGFGSNSGGFGGSAFGQNKTGFGNTATTSGGSLFGGGTATASGGFGGFGGTSSAFGGGSSNTGGGLFGQASKPAFGSTTSGSLFGGGASTAFGGGTAGGGFGSTSTPSFASTQQNNGTGAVPFTPHTDKDPGSTTGSNQYQSINAMPNYNQFSFEELRLEDYKQGRKFGTATGQPGGFGASNFGGFGTGTSGTSGFGGTSSGGGLFGTAGTTSAFGQQQNTGGTFGGGASGSLFGAKPSGGLFGSTPATSAQSGGGLFGTAGSTGFGGGTSSGGLFGQQQPKSGFAFGTTTTSSGGGLFGTTPATSGGFGTGQGTGGFGSFGQQNQQQGQTGSSLFGGGGFGSAQQSKPGGLFGTTTATSGGGSLFGQPAQQQASGTGLFGQTGTQQQSGGLFGAKPLTGGLFGASSTGNTGGSLFGGAQQQPQQTGSLFGASATQQPAGGLFAPKPATSGLGLFGSTAQQPATGSLFGATPQQQQQQPILGSSLFSSAIQQPQQQAQQAPLTLSATLTGATYGSPQLFAGLETPPQNLGPIATPLSSAKQARKQAIIPSYRINPNASSRLITPQKRPQGYGFSYSTYGTPGSASPSPMGFNNRLLTGGSIGRTLAKSYSSSNLRNSFSAEDSLLVPGAFTTTSRNGTGSLKKLNINRGLNTRRSLFGGESDETTKQDGMRKKVSFGDVEPTTNGANDGVSANGPSKALVPVERPPTTSAANGVSKGPEMTQVDQRGKELATVPEDSTPTSKVLPNNEMARINRRDMQPGEYWMRPTKEEIERLPRDKRKIKNFVVGREGVGKITFSTVDFAEVDMSRIFGDYVKLETRSATVYPDNTSKPPPGKGLNVPSEIVLDNCFPRAHGGAAPVFKDSGPKFEKHIARLKRIENTEFVHFDAKTGQWTFRVQHYTTYGLDYDEDESMLSATIDMPTPTPLRKVPNGVNLQSDVSMPSPPESDVDDTFDFKKPKKKDIPGQFDDPANDDAEMADDYVDRVATPESFLDERSVGSLDIDGDDADLSESESIQDQEMAGSFPLAPTAEHEFSVAPQEQPLVEPKSILKARYATSVFGTPAKFEHFGFGADWTEQLQRTVSPRKQDRQALREKQATFLKVHNADEPSDTKVSETGTAFATSIDLMHSLFGQPSQQKRGGTQFEGSKNLSSVHLKRPKLQSEMNATTPADQLFHESNKPNWGPNATLVYAIPGNAPKLGKGILLDSNHCFVGENKDVRCAKFSSIPNQICPSILTQISETEFTTREDGIPRATLSDRVSFATFMEQAGDDTLAGFEEKALWKLCSILFDDIETDTASGSNDLSWVPRKQQLSTYWKQLVRGDVERQLRDAESQMERALLWLTCGEIEEACAALRDGNNFHLATMVAQLSGGEDFRATVQRQLTAWLNQGTLCAFDDHTRTIYEILAGNVCRVVGSTGRQKEPVPEFVISSRFNLDWRRAFGLRLWYDKENTTVESVVERFWSELKAGMETVKPTPWFIRHQYETAWTDPHPHSRQDALWGILKLYAQIQPDDPDSPPFANVVEPENVSGNPTDARLAWQLGQQLVAHSIGIKWSDENQSAENSLVLDQLTVTYADSVARIVPMDATTLNVAVWILMTLSKNSAVERSVRNLLNLNAQLLNPEEQPLKIVSGFPATRSWEFAAKALYARAVEHNPCSEAKYLVQAGDWEEAHKVVTTSIGPTAVIEQDYDALRDVLGYLMEEHKRSGREAFTSTEWERGGGLLFDFVELCDHDGVRGTNRDSKQIHDLTNKLAKTLEKIARTTLNGKTLRERIAIQIMADKVVDIDATEPGMKLGNRMLQLPLTGDKMLHSAHRLAVEYYKNLWP